VVEFQDRLARFGFKYLETYFAAFFCAAGSQKKAMNPNLFNKSLSIVLLAILASFSAKLFCLSQSKIQKEGQGGHEGCRRERLASSTPFKGA
jgi:predicted site-specific integrase-resolvase